MSGTIAATGSDSGVKHLAQETLQFADDASGGKAESH
jgi:hypothetical protein